MKGDIVFGTDGWRAIMNDKFTFQNVGVVVKSIGDYLIDTKQHDKGVMVGYDPRFMSEKFAHLAYDILSKMNIKAYLPLRDAPTPVIAYSVKHFNLAGAIIFTASHNPPEYNGIKWIPDYAGPSSPEITKEIERHIADNLAHQQEYSYFAISQPESMEKLDITAPYLAYLEKLIDFKAISDAKMKIAYDAMHGAGRGYVDEILRKAGCQVLSLRTERDPLFGGSSPDPVESKLENLRKVVLEEKYDLGLATDGDSDRFGVIDSNGEFICPNKAIPLILDHLLKTRKVSGRVVRTVATTHLIDRIAKRKALIVTETPVGFKHICQEMLAHSDVIIGGEESGGLSIIGHIPEKDGVLANMLLVELVAKSGKNLTENLNDIMRECGESHTKRDDYHLHDMNEAKNAIEKLKTHFSDGTNEEVESVNTVDGVKVIMKSGDWFLSRMSGTEPVIRIYGESKSSQDLDDLLKKAASLMNLK